MAASHSLIEFREACKSYYGKRETYTFQIAWQGSKLISDQY